MIANAHYPDIGRPAFAYDRRYAQPVRTGQHRAIITSHPFVLHRDTEALGCGHMEDCCGLGREVRCGYYRRHHATMVVVSA